MFEEKSSTVVDAVLLQSWKARASRFGGEIEVVATLYVGRLRVCGGNGPFATEP